MDPRFLFISTALAYVGCPYIYGGRGELITQADLVKVAWPFPCTDSPRRFDCSGLVAWAWLQATGQDWRRTHNTDALLRACRKVDKPRNGTLCLYGTGAGATADADHVVIYLDRCVLGANGGDRTTTTLAHAAAQSARVCLRPSPTYRSGFLGYYELPWPTSK